MVKVTQTTGVILVVLALVMTVLSIVENITVFGIVTWKDFPFSFAEYLVAVGYVCAIAAVAEALIQGGIARWWSTTIFALTAYHFLFSGRLPVNPPESPEGQFALASLAVILSMGSLQLLHKAKPSVQ